jgi:hypothetical protein
VLAAFDPQIVWTETAGGPFAGTYTGPNAVLENVFGPLGSEWDEFVVQPDAYVCDGDSAVVTGTYRGTYRPTGRTLDARFAHAPPRRASGPVRTDHRHRPLERRTTMTRCQSPEVLANTNTRTA